MTTRLICFTRRAQQEPGTRFTSLMGLLAEPQGLRESFERQPGNKAPGVDGMRKQDYEQGVEGRLEELSAAVRRLGYRPKPVRRVYIAKSDGGRRPLGVPSFEDRIVQARLSSILQAIWEPEFSGLLLRVSTRPQRSPGAGASGGDRDASAYAVGGGGGHQGIL